MPRVLFILVHPNFENSKANQFLLDSLPVDDRVTIHDLYEKYPNHFIDVKFEQNLLLEHDIIFFQHPFYWYSCPALMKQWIDLVLEDGWAYGEGGLHLRGKIWRQGITTGGNQNSYKHDGFHKYSIENFLLPFKQTALLCGMDYQDPFIVHGTFQLTEKELIAEAKRFKTMICSMLGVTSE
ncbi:NAD(P)H-dependent oxidoreductase [Leptospira sp. 96542]|nr:NAD(P)H-dependent oxidoreductase [Leptospira sp. 96542]